MIELPKYTVPTYNPRGLAVNERTDFTRRIPALPGKQLARVSGLCEYDEQHIKKYYTHEPQNYDDDK